jgi:protein required for attachment to host cells
VSFHQRQTAPAPLHWVLVANAARARCFERDDENNALRELAAFVHPQSRLKGQALGADRGGLVHKGVASTQFTPRTDLHEKEHTQFARELASYLEEAALAHRFPGLALIASNPFLGELHSRLGESTTRLLTKSVALDLTGYRHGELERRVTQALGTVEA